VIVLLEHQSTINPNMALRLLLYIARIYEKILGDKNIYTTRAISIPRPEFFVLYNGTSPYPDEEVLKLSDAFESGPTGKEPVDLELMVRVININEGRNEDLVRRSRVLKGYSAFIAKVREYEKESGDREEALKLAIRYCREHDILKEFLERNASEVMNMLITEWNWDDARDVWYTEGREEGLTHGREEVARKALGKGLSPDTVSEITGLDSETLKKLAGK
jgi:predicted transposase/invertase (TIGR01784 family)